MASRACKRKPNFTESENLFLVQEFEKHKGILNSKLTSMETNRGKQNVWQEICIGLNRLNNDLGKGERTVKEIRRKWKNMVTSAKRHARQLKSSNKESNGRSLKPLSALSQKIIQMKSDQPSNADRTDDDTVIVEIKTEQEDGGFCTESISKKGPLEVFYSTSDSAAAVPSDDDTNPSHSPSCDDASFGESTQMGAGSVACELDEAQEKSSDPPGQPRKRVGAYNANSEKPRKRNRTHSTSLQDDLCELKREKLLLQIDKLKSEKDKLSLEKERLALEIQFWKKKVQSAVTE